jgi:hypothetical protein
MRILILATLGLGCGESSAYLEDQANAHTRHAAALAQSQDFARASEEQQRAAEMHKQAVERAVKEGRAGDLAFVRP